MSLCRFWNVSQRSRWSPRSSAATEDVGVAGVGGGSGSRAGSGGGFPGRPSWARGDVGLSRRLADGCLAAARLPPPAWPEERRERLPLDAKAAAAARASEDPGRFCPRRLAAELLLACRMAPAGWRAGLAARASSPPRARPRLLAAPGCCRLRPGRRPGSPARLGASVCALRPAGLTGPRPGPPPPTPRALCGGASVPSESWGDLGQP